MKKLLAGLFLAIAALPTSLAAGVIIMQHTPFGGVSDALGAASKVAVAMLGLAFFVFCSGLATRIDDSKSPE